MCFSASASFTASSLLLLAASATISKVTDKKYYLFSLIPLLFAIQQTGEGLLWLSFSQPWAAAFKKFATHWFLGFAYLVWPVWIPLSLYPIAQKWDKAAIRMCGIVGILTSAGFTVSFFVYPVMAFVEKHHIVYHSRAPIAWWVTMGLLYIVATIIPFFFIRRNIARIFGICLAFSYMLTLIFYFSAFVSIWCFFAAILSVLAYAMIE